MSFPKSCVGLHYISSCLQGIVCKSKLFRKYPTQEKRLSFKNMLLISQSLYCIIQAALSLEDHLRFWE